MENFRKQIDNFKAVSAGSRWLVCGELNQWLRWQEVLDSNDSLFCFRGRQSVGIFDLIRISTNIVLICFTHYFFIERKHFILSLRWPIQPYSKSFAKVAVQKTRLPKTKLWWQACFEVKRFFQTRPIVGSDAILGVIPTDNGLLWLLILWLHWLWCRANNFAPIFEQG